MKKTFKLLLIVSAILILISACSSSKNSANTNNSSSNQNNTSSNDSSKPVKGGTLNIADLNGAKTLDPHVATDAQSEHYIEAMYNTLFQYKKGSYGEIQKDLVKDYNISKDGKVYTLHLIQGVKFHNGDELTSSDVKYSINRIIKKKARASDFAKVSKIDTPDKYTVVITLKQAEAPFLTFLANPMNAIVDKKVVDKNNGSLANADAGSGPFQLVKWQKDQELVMKKFDNYFKTGKPYLDKVVWKTIPDQTSRTTALQKQEINIDLQIDPKDKMMLKNAKGIKVKSVPGTYWEYLGINTKSGPLANKKVREAIANAVDRNALNKVIKFGQASVLTGGPIPKNHWAYADINTYPKRNVAKAKKLMKEAGYANGFSTTIKVNSSTQDQVNAAQMIKQELADIGIKVNVKSEESSVFFDQLGKGKFDMDVVGWVGFVDPDEFLYNIFHTDGAYNQQNYSNTQLDKLLEEGRTTMDQSKRKEIYTKAQKIIAEDAPMVFLYANPHIAAMTNNVHGFDVNSTVTVSSLEDTWLSK